MASARGPTSPTLAPHVAHNIEVSARVPVRPGERVRLKGRYEWNDRGGVVHWTHKDPSRGTPRGWVEVGGRRYE